FFPYGVAVDHFQHLVYENPRATGDDRMDMWKEVEALYLPWRDCGDLPHVAVGGRWQLQRHIYMYPFYYIDYTLALACALQFWMKSQADFSGTLVDYEKLCVRGGEAPFRGLAESAGLESPFSEGVLQKCVSFAKDYLG
ncbi:peptidase M3, partial [bacterium]|nr:peptidase M3 [bacterium]